MEKIVTLKLTLHNYKKVMFPHCYLHNDVFIRLKTHTQLCAKLLGAIDILNQSSPKLPIRKCTMLHWQLCTMVHFLIGNQKNNSIVVSIDFRQLSSPIHHKHSSENISCLINAISQFETMLMTHIELTLDI